MISLATIVGVLSRKIEQYFLQVQFLQNMNLRHIHNIFCDGAKKNEMGTIVIWVFEGFFFAKNDQLCLRLILSEN